MATPLLGGRDSPAVTLLGKVCLPVDIAATG